MSKMNRRSFLQTSFFATASATVLPGFVSARVIGANDDIRYAVVGFGGRGKDHIKEMHSVKGTRMVALCDVDQHILERELKQCETQGEQVKGYTDVRKLLNDSEIDVV